MVHTQTRKGLIRYSNESGFILEALGEHWEFKEQKGIEQERGEMGRIRPKKQN